MNDIDVKIVDRACELIEAGWSKHANARDAEGNAVPYYSSQAICFCLQGAILRASCELYNSDVEGVFFHLLNRLDDFVGTYNINFTNIVDFNDDICDDKNQVIGMLRQFKETLI